MASQKVASILRSRSNFSEDQIATLSDSDAWNWVYAQDHVKSNTRLEAFEICFTGFQDSERSSLEKKATEKGLKVRTKVTQNLKYLCVGPNAGPSKLAQARDLGIPRLNLEQFSALCESGEIPI